ncbi:hypothetical protein GCM10010411_76430 [Actinomadura fulvescens]|uniref:TetR family transcriptional regulator n=1 Tax=Actinomadura fulvescens TaxID=46160 RepID=A0ABN3QJM2_9ACTN
MRITNDDRVERAAAVLTFHRHDSDPDADGATALLLAELFHFAEQQEDLADVIAAALSGFSHQYAAESPEPTETPQALYALFATRTIAALLGTGSQIGACAVEVLTAALGQYLAARPTT